MYIYIHINYITSNIIILYAINLPGSCPKNGKTFKRKAEKERAEKLLEAAKAEAISFPESDI